MLVDAVIFQGELDLLEMRLNELGSLVDQFVLIEMPYDLFGAKREFTEQTPKLKDAVGQFGRKVKIARIHHAPPGVGVAMASERFRAAVKAAMDQCDGNDVLMFSETWRIPKASSVAMGLNSTNDTKSLGCDPFWWSFWGQGASQADYMRDGAWQTSEAGGGVLMGAAELAQGWGLENRNGFPCISGAGWALRGFCGPQEAPAEFNACADNELWGFTACKAADCVANRKDAFGGALQWVVPAQEELPAHAWHCREDRHKTMFTNHHSRIGSSIERAMHTRAIDSQLSISPVLA